MVRTQISLTEEQHVRLQKVAARRGVSMSQVVREAIEGAVPDPDRRELLLRALEMAGRYRDRTGASDVANNHDRYLAESARGW